MDAVGGRFCAVKVTIEVGRDIPVHEDSILILKQDGVLGPKYMEISPGSPHSKPVAAGSELKGVVPPAITDLAAATRCLSGAISLVLRNRDKTSIRTG